MKKIILGTVLAFAFATGMGDVSALGKNKKDTATALDNVYGSPQAVASGCMGCIDELIRWAKTYNKADVKPLKAVREAFEAIATLKKLTGVGSIDKKITAALAALPKISSTLKNNPQCKEDITQMVTFLRGRVVKNGGYSAIENFYNNVINVFTSVNAVVSTGVTYTPVTTQQTATPARR